VGKEIRHTAPVILFGHSIRFGKQARSDGMNGYKIVRVPELISVWQFPFLSSFI